MIEALMLVRAWVVGLCLGAFFFGGLWWTVQRGAASPRPALWFSGSLALRMSVALLGLFLVAGARWELLLICLLGFFMARLAIQEVSRAPRSR